MFLFLPHNGTTTITTTTRTTTSTVKTLVVNAVSLFLVLLFAFPSTTLAQFGMDPIAVAAAAAERTQKQHPAPPFPQDEEPLHKQPNYIHNHDNPDISSSIPPIKDQSHINDLLLQDEDPELAQAIKIFSDMTPHELMETTLELRELFANDPDALEEMELVMSEIYKMNRYAKEGRLDPEGSSSSRSSAGSSGGGGDNEAEMGKNNHDLFSMAMSDTLDMLRSANEGDWDQILQHKDAILEVVIQSGFMGDEEAEIYRSNGAAWEEQLRIIWEELKKQAEVDPPPKL